MSFFDFIIEIGTNVDFVLSIKRLIRSIHMFVLFESYKRIYIAYNQNMIDFKKDYNKISIQYAHG